MTQEETPALRRKIGDQYPHAVTLMTPRQRELFPLDTTIDPSGRSDGGVLGQSKVRER